MLLLLFNEYGVQIQDKESRKTLACGKFIGGVYLLSCKMAAFLNMANEEGSSGNTLKLWHRRLGHCSVDRLKLAIRNNLVSGMRKLNGKLADCEGCIKGKTVKAPFPKRGEISSKNVLELVHTDVCVDHFHQNLSVERIIL